MTTLDTHPKDDAREVQELRERFHAAASVAADAFARIDAMVSLMLDAMETPNCLDQIERYAWALETIRITVWEADDDVSAEAGRVGCAFVDEAGVRRAKAAICARERWLAQQQAGRKTLALRRAMNGEGC